MQGFWYQPYYTCRVTLLDFHSTCILHLDLQVCVAQVGCRSMPVEKVARDAHKETVHSHILLFLSACKRAIAFLECWVFHINDTAHCASIWKLQTYASMSSALRTSKNLVLFFLYLGSPTPGPQRANHLSKRATSHSVLERNAKVSEGNIEACLNMSINAPKRTWKPKKGPTSTTVAKGYHISFHVCLGKGTFS